jgi:hypothetical protein
VTEWVTVVPAPGALAETARALLDAADDPSQVRTANAGNEFLVPAHVAERYGAPDRPKRRPRKAA